MTLKLAFPEVSVFSDESTQLNVHILWTEIKQVTFQANEVSVVKF